MGLLWGRLAFSSFHIILLPWLVADRLCVGVRGGTSFTTAKWNTVEHERSCSLSLYKTLSLQFMISEKLLIDYFILFSFVFMKLTFLLPVKLLQVCFFYKSTVLSKHPLHILMCVQWQYAFIKEKINTLFSCCCHLMGCYRLHNPYLDFSKWKVWARWQVVNVFLAERANIMFANAAKMEKHFQSPQHILKRLFWQLPLSTLCTS